MLFLIFSFYFQNMALAKNAETCGEATFASYIGAGQYGFQVKMEKNGKLTRNFSLPKCEGKPVEHFSEFDVVFTKPIKLFAPKENKFG